MENSQMGLRISVRESLKKAGVHEDTLDTISRLSRDIVSNAGNCDFWAMAWSLIDVAMKGASKALDEGTFAAIQPLEEWRDDLLRAINIQLTDSCGCKLKKPPSK